VSCRVLTLNKPELVEYSGDVQGENTKNPELAAGVLNLNSAQH
jgi:hypothetical protein